MGKITSSNGNTYTTRDVSNESFTLEDENGNESVYSFESDSEALNHVDDVENGDQIDAGDFGK